MAYDWWNDLERIAHIRRRLGLTQKDLARRSGVSQSLISKIEKGHRQVTIDSVKKIFEVFELISQVEAQTAKDIMSTRLTFAGLNENVSKAIEIMKMRGFSQLPVFWHGKCVGSISEQTILEAIEKRCDIKHFGSTKVKEVMGDPFPIVPGKTSIEELAVLLKSNPAVLVLREGPIPGIVTRADIMKVITAR